MKWIVILLLFLPGLCAFSQSPDAYGLHIISSDLEYRKMIAADSSMQLLEIKQYIPDIRLDIRYAGKNNFTGQAVYSQARAFARLPVIRALQKVQAELRPQGLGLKIYDAYRPYAVTVKFFDMATDKNFVANPRQGSRHNRGCAVDLTLVRLKNGKELSMPTAFDSFAPQAAADFQDLPQKVIKHRELLRSAMERHGFSALYNEWWHFDFRGWKNYDLMDIPFNRL